MIQTAPDGGRPRARCSRASSSSRAGSTARCSPPGSTTGSSATATTGATTRSSAWRPSWSTAGCRALPGKPPLGGEILSHDFVEAALLGRAGWYALARADLARQLRGDARDAARGDAARPPLVPGQPPAPASARSTEGFFGAHRALFLNGVLSYVSAFALVLLPRRSARSRRSAQALRRARLLPARAGASFPSGPSGAPTGRSWLVAVTGVIALPAEGPRLVLRVLLRRDDRAATAASSASSRASCPRSSRRAIFAPIRMVFHSASSSRTSLGRRVTWRSQQRGDDETGWGDALRYHGLDTVVASAWGVARLLAQPELLLVADADRRGPRPLGAALGDREPRAVRRPAAPGGAPARARGGGAALRAQRARPPPRGRRGRPRGAPRGAARRLRARGDRPDRERPPPRAPRRAPPPEGDDPRRAARAPRARAARRPRRPQPRRQARPPLRRRPDGRPAPPGLGARRHVRRLSLGPHSGDAALSPPRGSCKPRRPARKCSVP